MKRRAAREIAFKLTYEMVMTGQFNAETRDELMAEDADCDSINYVNDIVGGITVHLDDLKATIVKYAKGYEYDRIYKTDLALLLLSCYEIKYTDTPPAVVANETVEIAKTYSDVKSHAFINGILASVIKEVTNG
ncbi:MAG: transcription antitermination factor NusB [Clostridiales bacterium]|nr:transcription antitermination factor NusB [Clostridiales bacterium]